MPDIAPGSKAFSVPLPGQSTRRNATNLVVTLLNPLGYVVHEYATNPPPEPAATPLVTGSSAPLVNHVHPLDGGFMIGYSTHPDDTGFTLEYGTRQGQYDQQATIAQKGAGAIRGLENGRTYYGRLRREVTGRGASAWSPEFTVTPDGGLPPARPTLLGIVRGSGRVAVRFTPVAKATGYRLRWGPSDAQARLIPTSEATNVVLTEGEWDQVGPFSITALNAFGESAPSPAAALPPAR